MEGDELRAADHLVDGAMTRREIQAKTRAEMLAAFPIEGKLPDWYFRMRETSNSAWLVEGRDIWGRSVSRSGGDPEALLSACIDDAAAIVRQTAT